MSWFWKHVILSLKIYKHIVCNKASKTGENTSLQNNFLLTFPPVYTSKGPMFSVLSLTVC